MFPAWKERRSSSEELEGLESKGIFPEHPGAKPMKDEIHHPLLGWWQEVKEARQGPKEGAQSQGAGGLKSGHRRAPAAGRGLSGVQLRC